MEEIRTLEKDIDTAVWTIDPAHSEVKFITRHMIISKVTGYFREYSAKISMNGADFTTAKVDFDAIVNSITTGNEQRDEHLKSEDFFNATEYPKIQFRSIKINDKGDERYEVMGDLTIRNITKTIVLESDFGGFIKDPWGNDRVGFHLHGKINRFDFDLKWNVLIETGGAIVAEDIVIDCDIELVKEK